MNKRTHFPWQGLFNCQGGSGTAFGRCFNTFALCLALGAACLLTPALADEGDKPTVTLTVSAAVYQNTSQYDSLKPYEAYTQGKAALENGDASGYALLESSARRGCNQAKMLLAKYFLPADHPLNAAGKTSVELEGKSLDGKERMQRYLTWMNSAAENGSSTAAKELADLYREGKYVGKDAGQIFKYTKLAALTKEPEYMYRLGTYYAQGLGCQKDRAAAVKWIKNAAHAGNAEAKQWIADRRGSKETVSGMGIPFSAGYEDISMRTLRLGDSLSVLEQYYSQARSNAVRLRSDPGYFRAGTEGVALFETESSGAKATYRLGGETIDYYLSDQRVVSAVYTKRYYESGCGDLLLKDYGRLANAVGSAGYGKPSVSLFERSEWHTNGVNAFLYLKGHDGYVKLVIEADRKPKISGWEDLL
ncbi:sel1 repeat family protein [bacterium]|nr:sel1 repeat family protein [bacterium]